MDFMQITSSDYSPVRTNCPPNNSRGLPTLFPPLAESARPPALVTRMLQPVAHGVTGRAPTQANCRTLRDAGILAATNLKLASAARSKTMTFSQGADKTCRTWHTHLAAIGLLALGLPALPVMADSVESTAGRTAVARQAMEWDKQGKPAKLEFDFGDFKAWGRRDGSWNVEGQVQHRGLLCGTYTLLLRVGQGNPGCTNVQWFNEPRAVASTRLCNNATGTLSGGNLEFANADRFDEITCAERTISCSDNCK